MLRAILNTLSLVLSTSVPAALKVDAGYHALVIGNNAYQHLPHLETAVNDASVVADLLRKRYGFEIKLLLNASRYEVVKAMGEFRAELTQKDNLLVYYAGHGVLDEETDTGYWLPVDAEENSDANWIANDTNTRHLKAMSARHVLVVADSCYSGTLVRSVDVKLITGTEREAWIKRMAKKRSRTALVSGGLEPVVDAGGHGHSVFAREFIEALRENTEILDGQSLYDRIKRGVVVKAQQTPRYSDIRLTDHRGGDFLLVPVGMSAEQKTATTASQQSTVTIADKEALFWQSVKDSGDPDMFKEYLTQFPGGMFTGLARLKIAKLETPKAAASSTLSQEVPKVGYLIVRSNVIGDTVFIDGQAKGPTSPKAMELPPGTYTFAWRRRVMSRLRSRWC